MSRREDEQGLFEVASGALRRWLDKARAAVMRPYHQYKMSPDPTAIYSTQGDWNAEVETILTHIGHIAMGAWSLASNVPPVSRHAFVQASLAQTENLLVRIPEDVYQLVFAELSDGINAGDTLDQLAQRVDRVLTYTESERWPNRARVIAQTETTRAYGAGTLAAGIEQSRVTGRVLTKTWVGRVERERASHLATNGKSLPLFYAFQVGDDQLMFPGDPTGSPENVINCRCSLVIGNEEGRRG
jgi:hypothetical protein